MDTRDSSATWESLVSFLLLNSVKFKLGKSEHCSAKDWSINKPTQSYNLSAEQLESICLI